jgi:hypothetical protein
MCGKRRLAKEMAVDGIAALAQRGALIQTSAAKVIRERVQTVGRFSLYTVSARPAWQVGKNHMIAGLDLGNVPTHLLHHAGSLVP